jgi:hypothetical protein
VARDKEVDFAPRKTERGVERAVARGEQYSATTSVQRKNRRYCGISGTFFD